MNLRHVSRAAARLGLSQPAMSSALDRCRQLFGDTLLERGRGVMRPTPKAEALRAPLKALLGQVEAVLDPPAVDLRSVVRVVRIVMADHPAIAVVGALHRRLTESAPGIDLVVQPWAGAAAALDLLARGAADLAVSVFPALDPAFRRRDLLMERYVVLMRRGHPAARRFDLARWLRYPHIVVSGRGDTHGALDEVLARDGLRRRVGLVVPSFLMVPPLVAGSDLIAMLPRHCLPDGAAGGFVVRDPPLAVDGFPLHLAWHVRCDRDPAVRHVAGLIEELLTRFD